MSNDTQNDFKSQVKKATGEILKDGKRDWRKYKRQSLAISRAYRIFDELKRYAGRVEECGFYLKFKVCVSGHERRLIQASFCRCRLCIMCQWRKSLVMYHQVITLVHAHKNRYKSDIPLLLTLTVPNVAGEDLSSCLDNMQVAFRKLMDRRGVKRAVRSWFRGLEVTYNRERRDYHPHYHVLLLVPKNYFEHSKGLYIDRDRWLELWQQATAMPEITQVDVRRVKKRSGKGGIESVSAEVSKYATKPSSYVRRSSGGEFEADSAVVETLHKALKGRRLVGFGGLFNKLCKELKQTDVESADLINIADDGANCRCSVCQLVLVEELYKWHIGAREYVN